MISFHFVFHFISFLIDYLLPELKIKRKKVDLVKYFFFFFCFASHMQKSCREQSRVAFTWTRFSYAKQECEKRKNIPRYVIDNKLSQSCSDGILTVLVTIERDVTSNYILWHDVLSKWCAKKFWAKVTWDRITLSFFSICWLLLLLF